MTVEPTAQPSRSGTVSLSFGIGGLVGLAVFIVSAYLTSADGVSSQWADLGSAMSLPQRLGLRFADRFTDWGVPLFLASSVSAMVGLYGSLFTLRSGTVPLRARRALVVSSLALGLAMVVAILILASLSGRFEVINLIK